MKVTLYRYEIVNNGLGVWVAAWFASLEEAQQHRADHIAEDPDYWVSCDADECTGAEGQVGPVTPVEVEMTTEGLLQFANQFALSCDPMC